MKQATEHVRLLYVVQFVTLSLKSTNRFRLDRPASGKEQGYFSRLKFNVDFVL